MKTKGGNPARVVGLSAVSLAVMAAMGTPERAQAGGFQVTELCGLCQITRNAGMVAASDDPAMTYFNPAGLTKLKGFNASFTTHFIASRFDFGDRGSETTGLERGTLGDEGLLGRPPRDIDPAPATGRTRSTGADGVAEIPNLYVSQQIDDNIVAAVGITAPYGLVTEYNSGWTGRYAARKSDLLTLNINPSIGIKVRERLSVGLGFQAQYVNADLTNAVDLGSTAGAALVQAGIPGAQNTYENIRSNPEWDGFAQLKGSDWGFGGTVGLLWEASDRTRFGINYRSRVRHTLNGSLTIKNFDPSPDNALEAIAAAGINASGSLGRFDGRAKFDTPASLMFGGYHDLTDKVAIMASAWWTEWSSFKHLKGQEKSPSTGQYKDVLDIDFDWDNSWRFALGSRYKWSNRLMLGIGYEYDQSPVSSSNRDPRIPDQDRHWLSLGFQYKFKEHWALDFAYSHIFLDDYNIDYKEQITSQSFNGATGSIHSGLDQNDFSNRLKGEYKASADVFTIGFRASF